MGGVGAIRSLGRAGFIVHAASETAAALGLASAYASRRVVHPPLDHADFTPWFVRYVADNDIRMIVPGGGFGRGGHSVFEQYLHLFPSSREIEIHSRIGKFNLFEWLAAGDDRQRANLPPFVLVDLDCGELPTREIAELNNPIFIKLDGEHARGGHGAAVLRMDDAATACRTLQSLKTDYRKALLQGYVRGRGAGVFLLRWNGRILAKFMHLRLHEVPHTGGASSLRMSWWHDAMAADAETKLERVDWQGVAMVEYRWDPETDRFWLMEMNLRFWGSLHLALFAGVDFPRLLADAFFGHPTETMVTGRLGVVCRNTIPGEVSYLVSLWRDSSVPMTKKFHSLWEAVLLTLDPRVRNDLWFPGDRALYFRQIKGFLLDILRR
jgi:hypothetical protein